MRALGCFECGNTAIHFYGHIHRGHQVLTAGWCRLCVEVGRDKEHEFTACKDFPTGCLGNWMPMHK